MVPKHKLDLDSLKILTHKSDDEVLKALPQLLEWLQDCSWPVFDGVCSRLSRLKYGYDSEILRILDGDDVIWKMNVVGHFLGSLPIQDLERFRPKLEELMANATMEDFEEGLIDNVEIELARFE
jgi:hypothetical protein